MDVTPSRRAAPRLAAVAIAACLASPGVAWAQPPPPKREAKVEPPPAIELGAGLGWLHRFGNGAHFPVTERNGPLFSLEAAFLPTPRWSVGLVYERADLGREETGVGDLGSIRVARELDIAWVQAKVMLLTEDVVRIGLAIGAGLVWQSLEASGEAPARTLSDPYGRVPFSCSGADSADLAIGAALGASARITPALRGTFDLGPRMLRLGSEPLDGCVPGAGTVIAFTVRAGLTYRFEPF